MNSKALSHGMQCLGAVTILAGQRIVYYADRNGELWEQFDGLALAKSASKVFGPHTVAEARERIAAYQAQA